MTLSTRFHKRLFPRRAWGWGPSLSSRLVVTENVDYERTRAPQNLSALRIFPPSSGDTSGDLAGVHRRSARRPVPLAPRDPSQDTSLLLEARGCFRKFFLPLEQGRRPSTSAVWPPAPPLTSLLLGPSAGPSPSVPGSAGARHRRRSCGACGHPAR